MSNGILILTKPGDTTGQIVAAALEMSGKHPVLYYGAAFPTQDEQTIRIDGEVSFRARHMPDLLPPGGYRSVWVRRPDAPWLPPEISMEPADRRYVKALLNAYSSSLLSLQIDSYGRDAFWVNPMHGRLAASSKPLQLKLATQCGLRCPPTLVTNAPEDLRGFRAEQGPLICKPLVMGTWSTSEEMAISYTARLDEVDDLPEASIRIQPAIYQPCLDKAYEVRATLFGGRCFAIRIDSQSSDNSVTDARGEFWTSNNTTPFDLPAAIIEKCERLMSSLGIVYGAFDFIVDHEGDWTFLEVNEAGQCLFMENSHPQMPVLSAFTYFLSEGNLSGWRAECGPRLCDVERTDSFHRIREMALHWVTRPVL